MDEKKIAVIAIVIDDLSSVHEVNNILHQHNDIIIGRMGLPYKERGVSVISITVDSTPDAISSLTGHLGQLNGVSAKAAISKK